MLQITLATAQLGQLFLIRRILGTYKQRFVTGYIIVHALLGSISVALAMWFPSNAVSIRFQTLSTNLIAFS